MKGCKLKERLRCSIKQMSASLKCQFFESISATLEDFQLKSLSPSSQAQKVSDDLMQKISTQNRRALDIVVAKCYYYHARIYELLNKLDVVRR